MGRNIAGKTKRELLRKMNHKMSNEKIADVLGVEFNREFILANGDKV